MFLVQYDNGTHTTETYPTETAAQARAHWLVAGRRISPVVVFQADLTDDEGRVA